MTFNARVADLLTKAGVPLDSIMADSIRLEPHGDGFILKWTGAFILDEGETASLVAPTPRMPDTTAIAAELQQVDAAIEEAMPRELAALIERRKELGAQLATR